MKKKFTLFLATTVLYSSTLLAQSEFYIKGYVKVRMEPGTTPVLYVAGSVTNDSSIFHNNGSIVELTGNWTNIVGTGVTPGYYESTGIERFSGTNNSIVDGKMDGTGTTNNFYDLKVNKTDATDYVSLDTNTNVKNTLEFETNGILRTDIASYGDDGNLYTREVYVLSNASGAIIGAATAANEGTKYVEGKLRRQVAVATYFYPIGIEPGVVDAGSQPIEFTFTAADNAGVVAYFQDGAQALVDTDVFSDVGTDPVQNQVDNLDACAGGLDGIIDHLTIDVHQAHEWVATPNTGSTFNYSVTVYPSNLADVNALAPNVPCASTPLRYLAKDGNVAGLSVVSAAPVWMSLNGYITPATGYTISGQTGLSIFRLHTISSAVQGELGESLLELLGTVLLQGPYNTTHDIMDTTLNTLNLLPLTDPYGLGVTADVDPNTVTDIVDWVKIEVRDATTPATIVEEVAAFVKKDGTLVGLDGASTLVGLGSLPYGTYHIAIRHRNHLGVMTGSAINFGAGSGTVDFKATSPAHGVNGTDGRKEVETGVWALWAGNVNSDIYVRNAASPSDISALVAAVATHPGNTFASATYTGFSNVYSLFDVNLDGKVHNSASPSDKSIIIANVAGHPGNTFNATTYSITQQIP